MIDVTYIHHDCFMLSAPEAVLIFDYWKDPRSADAADIPKLLPEVPPGKPLYVFVSHFHKDHFNKSIFNWSAFHNPIHYIISKDTGRHVRYLLKPDSSYAGRRPEPGCVTVLGKFEEYSDDNIHVKAFGSTDIGNSYAVRLKADDVTIFHAGDLNCWAWRDESTPDEIRKAETAFRSELSSIAKVYPELDIAMFPVDSRIGTDYSQGAREFLQAIRVGHFFPMHFGLGDSMAEQQKYAEGAMAVDEYASGTGEIIVLTKCGDKFRKNGSVAG